MAQPAADRRTKDKSPDAVPSGKQAHGEEISQLRQDDFDRNVWCLLGLPVDILAIDEAVANITNAARTGKRLSFMTPNVNWLVRAHYEPQDRRAMLNTDLSLVDGAPLAALGRLLGVPLRSRVAGSDLFEALRRRPAYAGEKIKVFFFGGRDGAAEAAAKKVNAEAGGLEAVGWHNPGFGPVETLSAPTVIETINKAKPDFIIVALGAQKGQAWIEANRSHLNAPVLAHLGAVVDFTAGGIIRAPQWVRNLGLEWAWRIKEEPALWRRYFEDGLALTKIIFTKLFSQLNWTMIPASGEAPQAVLEEEAGRTILRLSGVFHRSDLRSVRDAYRYAAAQSGDVCLDFSNVVSFDLAFLGLLLMLEKHVASRGRSLFIDGAAKAHKKILRANMMDYPSSGLEPRRGTKQAAAA